MFIHNVCTCCVLPLRTLSSHIRAWLLPPFHYSDLSFLRRPSFPTHLNPGTLSPSSNPFLFCLPRIRLPWLLFKLSYATLRSFQEQTHIFDLTIRRKTWSAHIHTIKARVRWCWGVWIVPSLSSHMQTSSSFWGIASYFSCRLPLVLILTRFYQN